MKSQLFIPKTIQVGYQNRPDTYSGKLSYVIYRDNKGVLRKEQSWKGWIDQGHDGMKYVYNEDLKKHDHVFDPDLKRGPLPIDVYDNVPTEGFVLNRKVGGNSGGWNPRQTYCRVYDPRGFEFEITIPNLLFILENANSVVGKGLEGEFLYSWEGKDIVLLPANAQEYKESMGFTSLQSQKVSTKELIEGATYLTKNQQELVYLGKSFYQNFKNRYKNGKYVYATTPSTKYVFSDKVGTISSISGLTSLASVTSTEPVPNLAELQSSISKMPNYHKVVELKIVPYEKEFFENLESEKSYQGVIFHYQSSVGRFTQMQVNRHVNHNSWLDRTKTSSLQGYTYDISFIEDGLLKKVELRSDGWNEKFSDIDAIMALKPGRLMLVLDNGEEVSVDKYKFY